MKRTEFRLTTNDNPYDPFTQFKDWFVYDVTNGYNTSDYLARIATTSDQLSDNENDEQIEFAIDQIITNDVCNIYKKISRVTQVEDTM